MADLALTEELLPAAARRTLTYHEDHVAGDKLEFKAGDNDLLAEVPAGKLWDIQVTILVTETDA